MIRRATMQDVKAIHKLINSFAGRGLMLQRSLSDIYDHMRDYVVYVSQDTDGVVGVCGMHICWENLAEIRSLAVEEHEQGKKIASRILDACLSEAVTLGIYRVFVLTYVPNFFRRFGFQEVDKSALPHKVWADCVKCAKFPECDEIAMILDL